jgi:hypothetical protein
MAKDLTSVRVEPADIYLGVQAVSTVTAVADVSDSLDGLYFSITDLSGGLFHVWFNTSGGSAVDPAPTGSTPIVVALSTGASATAVASAIVTAVNAAAVKVTASSSAAVVTLKGQGLGAQTVAAATSTFSVASVTTGEVLEMGYIDGDIEIEFEEQLVDVLSQQSGTDILSAIRTGNNLSGLSFVLKQNSSTIREAIMKNMGWDAWVALSSSLKCLISASVLCFTRQLLLPRIRRAICACGKPTLPSTVTPSLASRFKGSTSRCACSRIARCLRLLTNSPSEIGRNTNHA